MCETHHGRHSRGLNKQTIKATHHNCWSQNTNTSNFQQDSRVMTPAWLERPQWVRGRGRRRDTETRQPWSSWSKRTGRRQCHQGNFGKEVWEGSCSIWFGMNLRHGLARHPNGHVPQVSANEERGPMGKDRVETEIWGPSIRGDHLDSDNSDIRKGVTAKNTRGSANPWGTPRPMWPGDRSSHFMQHTRTSLYMHLLQHTSPRAHTVGLHQLSPGCNHFRSGKLSHPKQQK